MASTRVSADQLIAMRRVEAEARDVIELAAALGMHCGPLREALDDLERQRALDNRHGPERRHEPASHLPQRPSKED